MVYHIENIDCTYKVGDVILPKVYDISTFSEKKQEIESCLEDVRKNQFPSYPSRLNCLYVCNTLEDVRFWAHMKYYHKESDFLLLTLALENDPIWFSAKPYHDYYFKICHDLELCSNLYWQSRGNPKDLVDCEGLYFGSAVIKRISRMRYLDDGELTLL